MMIMSESNNDNIQCHIQHDNLLLSLEHFEGPIDLLLSLAKANKVDLAYISVAELADQYLNYLQKLKKLRLEIASEYLVMASWLTYLKSVFLLPDIAEDNNPEYQEAYLKWQLERLALFKKLASLLMNRQQIDKFTFLRRLSDEQIQKPQQDIIYMTNLNNLLIAYGDIENRKNIDRPLIFDTSIFAQIDKAMQQLDNMIIKIQHWTPMNQLITKIPYHHTGDKALYRRSQLSALLCNILELAQKGQVMMQQYDDDMITVKAV